MSQTTAGAVGGRAPQSFETLIDTLRHRGRYQPDDLAYIFLTDGESAEQRATYRIVDEQSRAVARLLAERAPRRGRDERVLLLYPPQLEYIHAFYGCLCAGALAVPAYPPDPTRLARTLPRLLAIAASSEASVVLTTQAIIDLLPMFAAMAPDLAKLTWLATDRLTGIPAPSGHDPDEIVPARSDLAFLQYTSGSTAVPKGVMVSHHNIMTNEAQIREGFGVTPSDVAVCWLPFYHDMGLIGAVLNPMYCGYKSVLMSPIAFLQKPLRWLRAISRYRGTLGGGPNFAYELCIHKVAPEELATLDLSSWTLAVNGAEPIRADTLDRFAAMYAACGFRGDSGGPRARRGAAMRGPTAATPRWSAPAARSVDSR
jgi:acyl-CoA synthetase (AMP-forming)/AMP-acid ligase II